MKKIASLFLLVLLTINVSPSLAQEKMRIAVLDLTVDGVPARTARTVSDMLRSDLVNTGKFIVIERAQMEEILKEQGFQKSGCTDQECAVQLGKIMSARKILVGSVSPLGATIILNVRIVDVENAVVEFAAKEKADSEAVLDAAVAILTRKLVEKTGVVKEDKAQKEISVKNPFTVPVIGFSGLSVLSFAGGLYYNYKLSGAHKDYDSYAVRYKAATDASEANFLQSKMTGLEKDADKFTLYRNISYGLGAASLLATGYFVYKAFTYAPQSLVSINYTPMQIYPVLYHGGYGSYQVAGDRHFMGGGIIMRF